MLKLMAAVLISTRFHFPLMLSGYSPHYCPPSVLILLRAELLIYQDRPLPNISIGMGYPRQPPHIMKQEEIP